MSAWDPLFCDKLLAAKNYRQFIACFFEKKGLIVSPAKLSFQSFANRAGFSSKSFIADIIASRKRMTPASFEKVAVGLGLNKIWTEYFKCLVSIEEDSFQLGKLNRDFYQQKLVEIKSRFLTKKKIVRHKGVSKLLEVVLHPYFPEVFAALGKLGEGATLKEIAARTKLNIHRLTEILQEFEKVDLVEHIPATDRYRAIMETLEAEGLASSLVFEKDFYRSLEKTKLRFPKQVNTKEALFMSQTFSIKSSQLGKLRKELSDLINEFAESAESHDGDCIADMCIGFTSNR